MTTIAPDSIPPSAPPCLSLCWGSRCKRARERARHPRCDTTGKLASLLAVAGADAALRLARPFLRRPIGHSPDRTTCVVANQERAVLEHRECGRPAPDFRSLAPRYPEAGGEIFIAALRLPILERYEHDLVAGRFRPISRTLERDEGAAAVALRKLASFIEHDVERGRMRFEQQVRH